jgi:hypothetical protein
MSSFSLTEYLLRPVAMPEGAIFAPHAAVNSTQVSTSAVPSLPTVMRSSRARAWIPAHLIESLGAASADSRG